jgi:acetyl esterase/lipase
MLECYVGKAGFEERVAPGQSITPMDLDFQEHPPTFLVAGSKDRLCESTRICVERLVAGRGIARSKIYEGEMHGFFNMRWRPGYAELRQDLLAFLEDHDGALAVSASRALVETTS